MPKVEPPPMEKATIRRVGACPPPMRLEKATIRRVGACPPPMRLEIAAIRRVGACPPPPARRRSKTLGRQTQPSSTPWVRRKRRLIGGFSSEGRLYFIAGYFRHPVWLSRPKPGIHSLRRSPSGIPFAARFRFLYPESSVISFPNHSGGANRLPSPSLSNSTSATSRPFRLPR